VNIRSPIERLGWLNTLQADRTLSPAAVRVAIALAYRVNAHTGQLNPTMSTLAIDVGMSPRSVERAVGELQHHNYISVVKKWRYNHYELLSPDRTDVCSKYHPTDLTEEQYSHPTDLADESDSYPTEPSESTDKIVADTRQDCRIEQGKEQGKEQKQRQRKFTDVDIELAEMVFQGVRRLNPGHKTPNMETWANDVRKMREIDNRNPEQIRQVFQWANNDNFWQGNILCPEKLRKQFDQLLIKMEPPKPRTRKGDIYASA
jgi:AraC-like DNA-binding protein